MMELFLNVLYFYGITVGIVTTVILLWGCWQYWQQEEPRPRANLRRLK